MSELIYFVTGETAKECPPNTVRCNASAFCVEVTKFCNREIDCPDGYDEGDFCSMAKF